MPLTDDDKKVVADLIAAANKPIADALAESQKNQKVIADTLAGDAKARADAEAKAKADADAAAKAAGTATKKDEPPKTLTAEEITKLATDSIAKALADRDAAAKSTAARDAFLAEKMKDVPAPYQAKLGTDPAKWAAEEQQIREGLKTDLKGLGFTPKDVAGGAAGGVTTGGAPTATPEQLAAQFKTMGLSDGEASFASQMKIPAMA